MDGTSDSFHDKENGRPGKPVTAVFRIAPGQRRLFFSAYGPWQQRNPVKPSANLPFRKKLFLLPGPVHIPGIVRAAVGPFRLREHVVDPLHVAALEKGALAGVVMKEISGKGGGNGPAAAHAAFPVLAGTADLVVRGYLRDRHGNHIQIVPACQDFGKGRLFHIAAADPHFGKGP